MRVALILVLLFSTVAGCFGSSSKDAVVETTVAQEFVELKATATTGVIRGVVVDDAIRPLAGAGVGFRMGNIDRHANSTTTGAFGFADVTPGTYYLRVHKPGYLEQQASVEVVAGLSDPGVVKVRLAPDSSYVRPYFLAHEWHGFLECGTSVVALCAVPNAGSQTVGNATCDRGLPTPCQRPANVTNDQFITYIPVDAGQPRWFQHEMVWDSTQPVGAGFSLLARAATYSHYASGFYDTSLNSSSGTSPLLVIVNETRIKAGDVGLNGTGLSPSVFAGGATYPPQGCVPGAGPLGPRCLTNYGGAAFQQPFTVYTHFFYNYRPAAGWRFTADGDPPVPPA